MDRAPELYALPPGVDFATELVRGIDARLGGGPDALTGAEIWVNTQRTRRRIHELYHAGGPRILPKVRLVTELWPLVAHDLAVGDTALGRRLDLRPLVKRLIELDPRTAGSINATDLTDSLAKLLVEMADEDVTPDDLRALDVSDASGHWQRAQAFLGIAADYVLKPDAQSLMRQVAETLAASIANPGTSGPIFLAGSTGSRGPTAILMAALARTAMGHVILPGFDVTMDGDDWAALQDAGPHEDHPQFRFAHLAQTLGIDPTAVIAWTQTAPASTDRNALLSLALRPAPVTDGWMRDGPGLNPLPETADTMSLIEAPNPRSEATAIALCLREAADNGQKAALITPDRTLSRRVASTLAQWKILPDDSAGTPLNLTAAGRLVLMLAEMSEVGIDAVRLIALLSNPLVASGDDRPKHLRQLRDFEGFLRKSAVALNAEAVDSWQMDSTQSNADWAEWLKGVLSKVSATPKAADLGGATAYVIQIAEMLARGPNGPDTGDLWRTEAGEKVRTTLATLQDQGSRGGPFSPLDYRQFLAHSLSQSEVRDALAPHANIMIWGTLEARVQAVDLAILGGLTEGIWPQSPDPDPWLSRQMRAQAGLPSPERRIGLAAHDFQSAAAAPRIVLSRSVRDDDATTVASRWLNRLTNLMDGLPDRDGPVALKAMRARGDAWLALARQVDLCFDKTTPAPRPAPAPPVDTRPDRLSVTRIKTLIRDPYAIYADRVLGLRPMDSLRPQPDARLRGIKIHEVFERFVSQSRDGPLPGADQLLAAADDVFQGLDDHPTAVRLWRRALAGISDDFLRAETDRRADARPKYLEVKGRLNFNLAPGKSFTLSGIADRIDLTPDGAAFVHDYKTGAIATQNQQLRYDLQLYLLGLMVQQGAFEQKVGDQRFPVPAANVRGASFLGVGQKLSEVTADFSAMSLESAFDTLKSLLRSYLSDDQGYGSRAKVERTTGAGDYDHLARFGEWDDSTQSTLIRLRHAD